MAVSAQVEVRDGSGPWMSAAQRIFVTPGNVVGVRLVDDAGADTWTLTCIGSDERNDPTAVVVTPDPVVKSASFPAPQKGSALTFRSECNGGKGATGGAQFDFAVYTKSRGRVVHATNETTEGDVDDGWGPDLNDLLRNAITAEEGATLNLDASQVVWTNADDPSFVQKDLRLSPVTTEDATPIVLFDQPTQAGHNYYVTGFLTATSADASTFLIYRVEGAWSNVAGTLAERIARTIAVVALYESNDAADIAVGVDASNTHLQITATGLAGVELRWKGRLFYHEDAF